MILNNSYEQRIADNPDSRVAFCIMKRNIKRAIGATVIYNDVFPILVRLAKNTLNAFGYVGRLVIHWRDDAHQRLYRGVH